MNLPQTLEIAQGDSDKPGKTHPGGRAKWPAILTFALAVALAGCTTVPPLGLRGAIDANGTDAGRR